MLYYINILMIEILSLLSVRTGGGLCGQARRTCPSNSVGAYWGSGATWGKVLFPINQPTVTGKSGKNLGNILSTITLNADCFTFHARNNRGEGNRDSISARQSRRVVKHKPLSC